MSDDHSGWQPPQPPQSPETTPGFLPPPAPLPGYLPPGMAPAWPPQPVAAQSGVPRWLVALVLLVLVLSYAATVFFTKDIWRAGEPRPVVQASLQIQQPGTAPTPDALAQTRKVVESRLGHLGGHDVAVGLDGNTLKVTATDVTEAQLRGVTATGRLYIRPVIHAIPAQPDPAYPSPSPQTPQVADSQRIADEKALRQSAQPQIQLLALQFQATRCDQQDVLAGNDDPNLPLVTCSKDHKEVYLLDKSIISGDEIKDASSGLNQQQGEYVVDVTFKEKAADVWATFTAANIGTQTAFVLDSQVVSAPAIQEAIPGGRTQITGHFNATTAKDLANVLKYGSLPLSFESSEAETVSATLGLTSLRAGLWAGLIGLGLVLLYSLAYYRVLGVLTALSLVASGAMVFAILVLLGRYINYTLDLAGIAGLIIGIGTTADSFVVFFERIKDEIREGRSFRSAVPRGWARARKTILSGNAVTFLAALVLYVLAVGQVKGFAFTLGLTTILDVVVVFLVTWPLVFLASKSATLAKPSYNGLGAVQQIARERRAASLTGRG